MPYLRKEKSQITSHSKPNYREIFIMQFCSWFAGAEVWELKFWKCVFVNCSVPSSPLKENFKKSFQYNAPKKCLAEILFWWNYDTGFRVYILIFRYVYMTEEFMKLKQWLFINIKTSLPGLDCRALLVMNHICYQLYSWRLMTMDNTINNYNFVRLAFKDLVF